MNSEHFITWTELVMLQGYLALPVFILSALFQGLFLKKYRKLPIWSIASTLICTTVLIWIGATVMWKLWPFAKHDIQVFQAINLPALIAASILAPLVSTLVLKRHGISKRVASRDTRHSVGEK